MDKIWLKLATFEEFVTPVLMTLQLKTAERSHFNRCLKSNYSYVKKFNIDWQQLKVRPILLHGAEAGETTQASNERDPEFNKPKIVQNPNNPLAKSYPQRAEWIPVEEEIPQRWRWLDHIIYSKPNI